MKWLCSVGIAVSLALQPALADDLFGNHPLTPEARDAFVTDLLKKMTVDEKIGQLRLISVGPDNPKEAIREMIKDGQVGAIFNTVTRQDIRAMQDQVMELSRLKIPLFFAYDVLHGQRTVFPISLGLASSFNLDAVKTVGRVSAYEAADDGLNMTWRRWSTSRAIRAGDELPKVLAKIRISPQLWVKLWLKRCRAKVRQIATR